MRRILAVLALLAAASIIVPATAANAAVQYYRIVNAMSDTCLNQDYSGGGPHADVLAWTCTSPTDPAANEQWRFVDVGNLGNIEIINKATGKCLNQDYSGGQANSDVIVYTCSANYANGLWHRRYDDSNGTVFYDNGESGSPLNQDYSGGVAHHDVLVYYSKYSPPPLNSEWFEVPVG